MGQLLQAARARLRSAGVRGVVSPQPLSAGARSALSPRQGAHDADGAALSGPGLQSLPDVRGSPASGTGGHRAWLRAAGPDGEESLPPLARRAPAAGDRTVAGDARGGDRADRAVRARAADPG